MSISTFSPVILHEASYVDEVTRFVAHRYATSGYKKVDDADALLQALENEDRLLAPLSTIATMNDDSGRLLCTARVIIRTNAEHVLLPVERVFGYRAPLADGSRLIEIARLASVAGGGFLSMQELMIALYEHVDPDSTKDVVVACLDHSLYKKISMAGWPVRAIGEPLFYFGSETIPVRVDLNSFESLVLESKQVRFAMK